MAYASTPALNRFRRFALLAGLAAALAHAQDSAGAAPSWIDRLHLTASGTASRVENLSRTSFAPTRKDSSTYDFTLSGSIPRQLAPSMLLVGSGEVGTYLVKEYGLANHSTATARVSLQKKFGLGPQAWVLQGSLSAGRKEARLEQDTGFTTEAGLQLSKRILPNLRLAAAARWLEHDAERATFDLNQHSFSLDAQWDINEHWTLSGSATRLEGDIVANAAWAVWAQALAGNFGPTVKSYYTARPWAVTHIYGPNWVSYNVEADVDLWSVALAYAFTDRTSLEVRKGAAYVVNRIGVTYPTSSWSLSLVHRF